MSKSKLGATLLAAFSGRAAIVSLRQKVRKVVSDLVGTPESVKVMGSSVADIQLFF